MAKVPTEPYPCHCINCNTDYDLSTQFALCPHGARTDGIGADSLSPVPQRDECEHGRLRRKCEICELTAEVKELSSKLDAEREHSEHQYRASLQHMNQALENGSRARSAESRLDGAITLLRAAAWYEDEIGSLAAGIQQWLAAQGVKYDDDTRSFDDWRDVVERIGEGLDQLAGGDNGK